MKKIKFYLIITLLTLSTLIFSNGNVNANEGDGGRPHTEPAVNLKFHKTY